MEFVENLTQVLRRVDGDCLDLESTIVLKIDMGRIRVALGLNGHTAFR